MEAEQTGIELTEAVDLTPPPAEGHALVSQEEGRALSRADRDGAELMSMIQTAITSDIPVEKLERLMAMKERHDAKVAKQDYLDALRAFQGECPVIPKKKGVKFDDRPGTRAAYHYAPLEDITRIVDPILRRHGLSYSWTTEGITDGSLNVVCVLRHDGGHEERVPFPVPMGINAKINVAQKAGWAETYGMRRSLISILGLTTAEDDSDGREPEGSQPEEVKTITASQVADLDSLIDEVQADRAKFLRFMRVQKLDDIQQGRQHADAVSALEQKRGAV